MRKLAPLLLSILLLPVLPSLGKEVIRSYDSVITVQKDGSYHVTETIRVKVEGKDIKRGIYRDFPTTYKRMTGGKIKVRFEVTSVTRNGQSENYKLESLTNGKRIRIGRKEVMLPHEEHTYVITYKTANQIGYFDDFDEVYWNAIGTGWKFPIEKASARVILPTSISGDDYRLDAYTGPQGAKGQAWEVDQLAGSPTFHTTSTLQAGEGLTISVGFPKGVVIEPTTTEKLMNQLRYSPAVGTAFIGICLLLAYLVFIWVTKGIDPAKGVIIPRFVPPEGLSPAAARYVMRMGYDNTCFAAALINLGVKKRVKIDQEKRSYEVSKLDGSLAGLAKGEQRILSKLFAGGSPVALKQKNHTHIGKAVEAFKKALKTEHASHHFRSNKGWLVPAVLLAIANVFIAALMSGSPEGIFFAVWLSIWSLGVTLLLGTVFAAWKSVFTGSLIAIPGALFITAFSIPFVGGECVGLFMFSKAVSVEATVMLVLQIPLLVIFNHLFKQPTVLGRQLMDELEGFRMYLDTAEKDLMASMYPPQKTPELFEKYLPYALALGVEQRWAEKFEDVLQAAAQPDAQGHRHYHPAWYHSPSALSAGALAGAVGGALASAVASSSTAPGSSSGGGGGGSSGGGGGGGGGGGW